MDLQHETESKSQGGMNRGRREPGQSLETEPPLPVRGEKKEPMEKVLKALAGRNQTGER